MFMNASDHFKIQKICKKAVEEDPEMLEFVPDHFEAKEIREKLLKGFHMHFHIFLISIGPKTCVKVLF